MADAAGATISFDVNHRSRLWRGRDAATTHRRIAARAALVFAGEEEAELLAPGGGDPSNRAAAIAALGPTEVVIKRGAAGALVLVDGTRTERVPAVSVDLVVDTVGAGDAFVAGYLAERLAGRELAIRLDTALRAGAAACRHPGTGRARPPAPSWPLGPRPRPGDAVKDSARPAVARFITCMI